MVIMGIFFVLIETVMMFVAFYGDMLKQLLMEYGPTSGGCSAFKEGKIIFGQHQSIVHIFMFIFKKML